MDSDRPVFTTGALKVNPEDGDKDGGLAAVVMTIGEEKVKGVEGGVEGAVVGGTSLMTGSTRTGVVVTTGLGLGKLGRLIEVLAGRAGSSAISSSGRLDEGLVLVLSLFIFPPPDPVLLVAGVLDRG